METGGRDVGRVAGEGEIKQIESVKVLGPRAMCDGGFNKEIERGLLEVLRIPSL